MHPPLPKWKCRYWKNLHPTSNSHQRGETTPTMQTTILGKAAFNVGGTTIHSMFCLRSGTNMQLPLSNDQLD